MWGLLGGDADASRPRPATRLPPGLATRLPPALATRLPPVVDGVHSFSTSLLRRTEDTVCVLPHAGARSLGLALLQRTSAALDLLLAVGPSDQGLELEDEPEAAPDGSGPLVSVCRALPFETVRSFVVELGSSARVRVTACLQHTCSEVLHRMGVDELLQHLVRAGDGRAEALGSRPGERVRQLLLQDIPRRTLKGRRLAGAGPYLGHQVVRLRLLSARIAQRALGDRGAALADRAGSLIDCALERLCAHGGLDPAWWEEELVAQDGAKAKREGSGADDDVYMSVTFRLVVKNSFIEALEVSEDSGGIGVCDLRRTVSDPVLLRPRCGSGSSSSGGVAWPPPVDRRPAPAPRPPLAAPGGGRGVAAGGGDSGAGPEAAVEAPGGALLCGPGCPVEAADADEGRALVMLHAIPDEWTRATVVDFLHCRGAEGRYNFVYLPMDFSRGRCLGYALVNFCEAADAAKLLQDMSGELPSEAPAAGVAGASPRATWNEPSYSVEELVEKYRNSPVMHSTVPEEFKPLLFEKGRRLAFPPPTKAIRPPRIRHSKAASDPRQRPARA